MDVIRSNDTLRLTRRLSRELYSTAIVAIASAIAVSVIVVLCVPPNLDMALLPWALMAWALLGIGIFIVLLAWTAARARVLMADVRHARMLAAHARDQAETAAAERIAALELTRVAHEQIGRVSRERIRLLNELSHRLRTPLQAVVGWCDLMKLQGGHEPAIAAGLEVIRRNARSQAQIIAEILGDARNTAERLPQSEVIAHVLDGLIVLIVEDQADSREFLRVTIAEAGALVVAAASAEEGLLALETHQPDIIVSDLGLPGADGLSFLQSARARGFERPALA